MTILVLHQAVPPTFCNKIAPVAQAPHPHVRLPDVLERQRLSLNLLSKRVMSLILEKRLVVLEYFPASLKIFKIVHLRTIDYVKHARINNVNEQGNV